MDLLSPIKDHHRERQLFIARVALLSAGSLLLLAIVIVRLVQLQVLDYEDFAAQSQGNRVRIEPVPPIRGLIFDRNGRVLAENLPAYQLEMIPEQIDDIDDTLHRLAALGLLDALDIPRLTQLAEAGPRFKPVTLNLQLSDEEIANFAIQRPRFPGVDFQPRLVRHYPHGEAVAHAVGYVGAVSSRDLERLEPSRYTGTAQTGKTGVELTVESTLHGFPGYRHVVTNALGRTVLAEASESGDALPADATPAPGNNVILSLDLDLQLLATELMRDRRGSAVAIDPWSGDVLALVSAPSFDPNLFAVGMSGAEFAELQNDPDQPLFNRATRGTYPPGSTIKPMLALAALETGATNLTRKTMCRGYFRLPNTTHRYRDWKPEGHGEVVLHDAIEQSCDVYFYEISTAIGIDRMHDYLEMFGLGRTSGLDIGGESSGLVPSRDWKRRAFRNHADQRWFQGETVIASIGQGYMLATPLQLASAAATLATRGVRHRPRLITATEDVVTGERARDPGEPPATVDIDNDYYWSSILDAMRAVMHGPRGTARAAGSGASYRMAGKSGTAQVFSLAQEEEYDEDEIAERLRDHALFIAFAPFERPSIAVAVIVENGSSGSRTAAPIARAILDQYLGFSKYARK